MEGMSDFTSKRYRAMHIFDMIPFLLKISIAWFSLDHDGSQIWH
jgi:hypothetical protein